MVVIRLSRVGSKKRPFFHIVATDKRNSRDGRFIEKIGYFNPIAKGKDEKLLLEIERFEYFLKHGAQCSDRAKYLLKKHLKDNKLTLNENITPEKKKKASKSASADKSIKTSSTKTKEPTKKTSETDKKKAPAKKATTAKTATKSKSTAAKSATKKAAKKD